MLFWLVPPLSLPSPDMKVGTSITIKSTLAGGCVSVGGGGGGGGGGGAEKVRSCRRLMPQIPV